MKILLTGGTGLLGNALIESLLQDDHTIIVLTRSDPSKMPARKGLILSRWDGRTLGAWAGLISDVDVIVNLAGESLSTWPWTARQKQRFHDSRVLSGRILTTAIKESNHRPAVFIQVSGINHYGLDGDVADENTGPGDDYLARLTVDWESATQEIEKLGVRRCVARMAVVLSPNGGLFPLMSLPVRLFFGGRIGNGRQAINWIHQDDVVHAIRFLIETEGLSGAFNLVAPERTSNEKFYRTLAKKLHRPFWFPTPGFLLRLVLGEMSVLVLDGRYSYPKRLLEAGYQFRIPSLDEAMEKILH